MGNFEGERFTRYRAAAIINLIICILQGAILWFAWSVALLGDTAHSISDGVILVGTCFAAYQATFMLKDGVAHIEERMTRISLILLWIAMPFIFWEGWGRMHSSVQFSGWPVVGIALVSMIGNMGMHKLIHGIGKDRHNHLDRANLLHMLGDILLSGSVLLSAALVLIFHTAAWDGPIAMIATTVLSLRGIKIWKELTLHQKNKGQHAYHHHKH